MAAAELALRKRAPRPSPAPENDAEAA